MLHGLVTHGVVAVQHATREQQPGGLGVNLGVAVMVIVACAALTATILLLDRRRKREPLLGDEREARAEMDALCPQGWHAQLTVYGEDTPLPEDAPPSKEPLVSVDWAEYVREGSGQSRVAVTRRSWGHSIVGALRAMVADRRLDLTLEEIERGVEDEHRRAR